MTAGFGGDPNQGRLGKDMNITIDIDYVDVLLKKYKKLKKYQKSSLYAVKKMDGNENIISTLIKEAQEDPL
jgi:hypothetical protein